MRNAPGTDTPNRCLSASAPALALTIFAATLTATEAAGQEDAWFYRQMPEAEEVALARSAAPPSVSDRAEIWVIRRDRYEVAVPGANGNACLVIRGGFPGSLAPTCYDAEATRTILPMEFRKLELQLEGNTRPEIFAILAQEMKDGALPMPIRPAMAYMMSPGQRLRQEDGGLGPWQPHIMLYTPFLRPEDMGLAENSEHVMVINGGSPRAFLMVLVPSFTGPMPS
ncbi:MAG: hypothetical protein ABFS34_01000 [Gemmatimonadota bacterium]